MAVDGHPRVLCVDDEPHVLDGLSRHLRRDFAVATAVGASEALAIIEREGPFAVVVSDMRMPGMDGAAFLRRVREIAPDTVRLLLTGHADLDAAIAAVNQANIFRFLTKPCPPDVLVTALAAAADQYRLITTERVLLEQTLHGSIKALTDVLALVNPAAFGRSTRVKQHVSGLAARLDVADRWQVEVAAMLSQIGCVTLPPQTAEKLYRGEPLTGAEQAMTSRLPAVGEQLLGSIPRLEAVREILAYEDKHFDGGGLPATGLHGERIPLGARMLKVVLDFDKLEAEGMSLELAIDTLRGRAGWYDTRIVEAFAEMLGGAKHTAHVREVRLREVRPGMVFVEDVVSGTGVLLIARGQEVTVGLLERIHNFSNHIGVREPVRVLLPASTWEPSRETPVRAVQGARA
jgi:response regulator RpfG family c-di-GMP phosphodiesterase